MPAANLAAIFQPGIISHPDHEMSPADYRLSQDVLIFLILNQDNFLLGMRGSDENENRHHEDKVPSEGYQPSSESPRNQSKNGLDRHPSNASAGAESVKKFGIQRHNSTSSRKSVSSPTVGPIGLSRSNTVPSKNRSPSVTTPTFPPRTPQSPRMPVSPRFPQKGQMSEGITPEQEVPDSMAGKTLALPAAAITEQSTEKSEFPRVSSSHGEKTTSEFSEMVSPVEPPTNSDSQPPAQAPAEQSNSAQPLRTPTKEKSFSSYFARSPGSETERKTSNKLRKKRIPGSQNPSAESSTASLNGTTASHPPIAISQQIPPASNPTSQQPPLLPISASPPNGLPVLDTRTPAFQANIQASTPVDPKQLEPPAPGVPHGRGAPSASTSSLVQQVSQTPSQASSLSSQSSQPDDSKLNEKPKQKSIWRKSAQKLNLGSAQATAQATADKLSGLISPPFVRPINSNGSTNSLNSKGRRRSHSVGEKAGEAPKEVSTLPQRGASASGQHTPSTENLGAISWLQKKINERKDKGEKERDATAGPPQFPMLSTTPIAEVDAPPSPKR
ncbi:hypothetical protein TWF481_005729 [Arthrobotrys musiformis]